MIQEYQHYVSFRINEENDALCQYSLNSTDNNDDSNSNDQFDNMVYTINDIVSNISNNSYFKSILPSEWNYTNICENYNAINLTTYAANRYDLPVVSAVDGYEGMYDIFKLHHKGALCCLTFFGCAYANITKYNSLTSANDDSNGSKTSSCNVFCNGGFACFNATLNVDNCDVMVHAGSGAQNSVILFADMILCGAGDACWESQIENSRLLLCLGSGSCHLSVITNTSIIIATGSSSLSYSTILCDPNHDTTIYLFGDDAGKNLTISFGSYDINYDGDLSADNPGCVIYCQSTACDHLITTSPLYCDPTGDIGTTKCSFFHGAQQILRQLYQQLIQPVHHAHQL